MAQGQNGTLQHGVNMKKINIKKTDGLSITGIVTIRSYKAGTNILLKEIVQKNMIMQGTNTGKDLIVQRLIGTNTYSLNINYGAIGTSGTAVAQSDTQLGAESARSTVALAQESGNNKATLQFFFADANLTNATYREFGVFVDGTASANSGQIFNHALFTSPYIKAGGTDTTVQIDIEFT